jgi:hypothetical protein
MLQDAEELPQPCPSCGGHIIADTYKEYLEVEEFTRHQLQIMKDIACILHVKRTVKSYWSKTAANIKQLSKATQVYFYVLLQPALTLRLLSDILLYC